MVSVRMIRKGKKNQNIYHIVVSDSRYSLTSPYIELIGFFKPKKINDDLKIKLNCCRIYYWLSCGAHMSIRVKYLLRSVNYLIK